MIIKTSPDEIQNYLIDASNYKGYCNAVYFPEDAVEIAQILTEANLKKTPVTISGNGTGLAGGRVPEGGIVIATDKMNKILEINTDELTATLQPGVILSDFLNDVKEKNLLYPPDPTEKNCFVGGTVATNASGEKTFRYGPTRDYILALEIVLPGGDILELTRGQVFADGYNLKLTLPGGRDINIVVPEINMPGVKNASGYFLTKNMDAIDLFIGSEGTLGVITKIKLKLLPQPEKIISCVVFFKSEKDALAFINKSRELTFKARKDNSLNSIDALALEFFDENSLKFLLEEYPQIPQKAMAGVWFEQEVTSENENIILEEWLTLVTEFNGDEESAWFALNESDKTAIQQFRHSISAKVNEYISKNNLRKLGTDVAVPDNSFEELYYFSKKLVSNSGIYFVIYGHFGNSHMHLNMLPKSNGEWTAGREIYGQICQKAIELKGTVSAEHGIGKIKTGYLFDMYGSEAIEGMRAVKKAFDPGMILGAGTMFKA